MSATVSFETTWRAYKYAVTDLYRPPEAFEVDRGPAEIYDQQLEDRSSAVLDRSREVRVFLTSAMDTDDLAQRELASLKLLSAAAYDLAVAGDLLELDRVGLEAEPDRSARQAMLAAKDLQQVLDAPLKGGMKDLLDFDMALLPRDANKAREALEGGIAKFTKEVPEDAADLCQTALASVVTLGIAPISAVASVAVRGILEAVPEGASRAVRAAVKVVVEAVSKLWTALGEDNQDEIQDQAGDWLKELQEERDTVTGLLDELYETERIGEEVNKVVEAAPAGTEARQYNQATKELKRLSGSYRQTKKVLSGVMKVLGFAGAPLMGAVPWGPVAVYGTYSSILAYSVFSGGDYLDWYRIGGVVWLDRVKGVRVVVHDALGETE